MNPATVASDTSVAVVADFNGDNIVDLAFADGTILLGKGDGTFTQTANIPSTQYLVVADMNLDGKPDIITSTEGTDANGDDVTTALAMIGNGDGTFHAVDLFSYSQDDYGDSDTYISGIISMGVAGVAFQEETSEKDGDQYASMVLYSPSTKEQFQATLYIP